MTFMSWHSKVTVLPTSVVYNLWAADSRSIVGLFPDPINPDTRKEFTKKIQQDATVY
jgi:hypothetical protein